MTPEVILNILYGLSPLVLLVIGWCFGSYLEKKHYKSINTREADWLEIPASNTREFVLKKNIQTIRLATGSTVVAIDHFKRLLAGLRTLFGGEMVSYASLLDRARREALLRMKEQHPEADEFVNCRLETSPIGSDSTTTVEVLAYGTAIYYQK